MALSSPNVAELDGQPAVVFGDRAGWVYAFHLADGSSVAGWPYYAGAPGRLLTLGRPNQRQRPGHGLRGRAATPPRRSLAAIKPSARAGATSGSSRRPTRRLIPTRTPRCRRPSPSAPTPAATGSRPVRSDRTPTHSPPAMGPCSVASRGSRPTRCSRRRRWPTSTPTTTPRSSAAGTPAPGLAYGEKYNQRWAHPHPVRAPATPDHREPGGRPDLPVQHQPEHRPLVAGRRPVPRRRRRGHRDRRRQLLPGRLRTRTRSSPSTRAAAWPGATPSTGSPPTRPPSPTSQGNGQLDVVEGTSAGTIYVLNGTNGAAVWSAPTSGPGHRLPRHGRPHRRGLPGRHRAHHQRDRHLRRALGRPGGAPWPRVRVPELSPRHRRPRTGTSASPAPATPTPADSLVGVIVHWEIDNTNGSGVERLRERRLAAVPPRPAADGRRRHPGTRTDRGAVQRTGRRTQRLPPLGHRTAECSTTATSPSAGRPAASTSTGPWWARR